jgi:hypothetical protein
MSTTTIDMLVARIDTLEKQVAMLLKKDNVEVVNADTKSPKKPKKSKDESSSDDEIDVKKTKKDKKKESSSDDDEKPKKKRGPNGYILFSKSVRDEIILKLTVGEEKPKNTDIMKQQAQMWQSVSADEKAVWNAKAKEANLEDA